MTELKALHVALGGGLEHMLGTVIGLVVALTKGYTVEPNTSWKAGGVIPDGIIYKPGKKPRDPPECRYWLETIATHDPRKEWKLKGFSVTDVLTADISGCRTLDEVLGVWMRVIP